MRLKLRIAASYFFLLISLVFAELWIVSQRCNIYALLADGNNGIIFNIAFDQICTTLDSGLDKHPYSLDPSKIYYRLHVREHLRIGTNSNDHDIQPGFLFTNEPTWIAMAAPCWFVLLLSGLLALSFRPSPRFRFSLRDALASMTIAASVAGTFAILVRLAEN